MVGDIEGTGIGGRATGPGGLPYLLTGDAASASDTLQTVTDRGSTTTTDVTIGNSSAATAPLTIVTDTATKSGIDIYADGDLGNKILTIKADAGNAGELSVKDTAGLDSVKLANTSSRGQVDLYDGGGTGKMTLLVDSNNQGELTLKDSSANDSVKLNSDSNKRGTVSVHDSAGVIRMTAEVDSNEQGKLTLKDSSANDSIKLASDSNKRGVMDIYDAAGTSKIEMKADSNDEGVVSIKDSLGTVSTKVQGHKSIISAAYSNIYSTGSVIIGGSGHIISGDYDVIAGGAANDISGINGNFNFIGGGSGICIEESAYSSSVGGLNNDIITGDYSVIAGGKNNLISGNQAVQDRYNFIGGGLSNTITGVASSAIMGGEINHIEGINSFIGGGNTNNVYGEYAFIGGGEGNIARGDFAAILAGENNIADGQGGVIVGGDSNFASGNYSLVGGQLSKASGDYSYAFGRKALVAATHDGAAVLADGQNRTHTSSGEHTLNLDFASGVYIGGGAALYVSGNPVMTGAHTVEEDTFQTVTNRGDTTTNSIEVAGKFLSGVTGKFSGDLDVGSTPALSVSSTNDRVGVGMNASDVNGGKFGVYGGAAIGSSYAPYYSPPSNGLLVEGRVGIGTTAPNAAHKLHVNGGAFATGVTIGNGIEGTSPPNNGLLVYGGATLGYYAAGANILDVYGNAAIGASYWGTAAPSNGLIVQGNVGVGTSSPKTALDVRGTISGYTGLFDDKVGIGTNSPQAALDVARDTDVSGIIGRAQIGYAGDSDVASFAHVDFANATDFALAQTSAGHTVINARDGYNIYVREGDANIAIFNGSTKDFYVDTDTLYVDASEDSVGINTSAPTQELDVRGTTLLSGQAIVDGGASVSSSATLHVRQKGNADTDGIALTSSNATSHRVWKDSNGKLNIGPSSNTDAFVQDLNGNVGILTNAPNTALDVRGTISGYTGLFDDKVGIGTNAPAEMLGIAPNTDVSAEIGRAHVGHIGHSDYAGFSHIDKNTTTSYALLQQSNGATYLNAANATNIYFRMNNAAMGGFNSSTDFYIDTDTLYVDASEDRVGINESSPSYTLDVNGEVASSLLSRFYNTSTTNGQGILVRAGETANANRILQLASRDDTKVMTVNSNGRVGIGADTTPDYRLDLGGDTSSTSNTLRINQNNGGTAIRMGAGGGSSDVVMLRIDGSSTAGEHDGETDKSKYGFSLKYMGARSANANSLSLFCDDQAAANQVEGLTVTQSGQLGILSTGISNFGADEITLQVGGPVDVDGSVTATTDLTANTSSSYTFIASDQSNMVSFNSANPITGLIPPNSSVPFPIGTEIGVFQLGAGQLHITTGSSAVSLNAADAETKARVQFSTAMCLKTGTDGWLLVGDLTS